MQNLSEAFDQLKLPCGNPIAFRKLAEDHIIHVIPTDKLRNVWKNLEEVHHQAGIAKEGFLMVYGEKLWDTTSFQIQSNNDFQRRVETYFIHLLQIPRKIHENHLLEEAVQPRENMPRKLSCPGSLLNAEDGWLPEMRIRRKEGKDLEELYDRMAQLNIEEATISDKQTGLANFKRAIDASGKHSCVMEGCEKRFATLFDVNDHIVRDHPD